jgi:hypothetical protein
MSWIRCSWTCLFSHKLYVSIFLSRGRKPLVGHIITNELIQQILLHYYFVHSSCAIYKRI